MKMKKIILSLLAITGIATADVYVKGHYRKNGSYVNPHYRSNPNGNRHDNWSTQGNTNPYTGSRGTVRADSYDQDNYSHDYPVYRDTPSRYRRKKLHSSW